MLGSPTADPFEAEHSAAMESAVVPITYDELLAENSRLGQQVDAMQQLLRKGVDRRRAMLHILQDAHETNQRLGQSRKAMIHIMGDLRDTTREMQRRERELREKQDQLVQAAKLAT